MSVPSPGPDGTNGGLPVGGTTGQVLTKDSNADFDADWQNAGGGGLPAGGSIGQTIINTGPGAGTWQNAPPAAPLAHAPSHESGGSDPITNLGPLDQPFNVEDGSSNPVMDVDAFGVTFHNVADVQYVRLGYGIIASDGTVDRFTVTPTGAVNVFDTDGATGAALSAGGLSFVDAVSAQLGYFTPNTLSLGDGTAVTQRAVLKGDGTGLLLLDATNAPQTTISEALLSVRIANGADPTNPSARILSSDASLLLEHYDSAGTGTLLSSLVLGEPGSNALVWKAADESPVVTLRDDGTGLTMYDSSGVSIFSTVGTMPGASVALDETQLYFTGFSDGNHATPVSQASFAQGGSNEWTLSLGDTAGSYVSFSPGASSIYDSGSPTHGLTVGTAGISTFGDIAVMGATPYGQDAFIDPTVITPEQLANYQIARGFMAAV